MTTSAKTLTLTRGGTRMLMVIRAARDRGGATVRLGPAPLPEPAQPEDKENQGKEDGGHHRDHVRGVPQGRRHGFRGRVLHHAVDVPGLADPGAGESPEPHEPG